MLSAAGLSAKNLSNILDPSNSNNPQQTEANTLPLEEYDINHLDYQYLGECDDLKQLRHLLLVLRSGKEGCYPELEDAFEAKIATLDPDFITRKSGIVTVETKRAVEEDLEEWVKGIKDADAHLRTSAVKMARKTKPSTTTSTSGTTEIKTSLHKKTTASPSIEKIASSTRIKSGDYRAWDKYDIEAELKKIDQPNTSKPADPTKIYSPLSHTIPAIPLSKTSNLSPQEITHLTNQEKNKGNECLKAREYEEAVAYYTRAIQLSPEMPNLYTNRALAYLKMESWEKTDLDSTKALSCLTITRELELKAIWRRGISRQKRGQWNGALNDFKQALEWSITINDGVASGELIRLHDEAKKHVEEEEEVLRKRAKNKEYESKTRMKIYEIEDDEEEANVRGSDGFRGDEKGDVEKAVVVEGSSSSIPQIVEVNEEVEKKVRVVEEVAGTTEVKIMEVEDEDSEDEAFMHSIQPPIIQMKDMSEPALVVNEKPIIELASKPSQSEFTPQFPVANTYYQFETAWRTLKQTPKTWHDYILQHEASLLVKILAGGEVDVIEDVVNVLGEVEGCKSFVHEVIDGFGKSSRMQIALKMMGTKASGVYKRLSTQ